MPICLFAAVFATTTKIGDLTAALYGMRLPKTVVVPLVIAVRFFPTLKEESSAVADAMRVRGLALSLKNLVSKPALMFESAVVPVMLRCAKIADELAAAAVARGIDRPGRKTSYNAPRFGRVDFLSLAFLVICCSLLVAVKVNQGIGACCDEKRRRAQKRLLHLCGIDAPAVDDVSLAVAPGECIVLCGESGCGKTTATRIVNGLAGGFYEGSRTGEILVASRDIDDLEDWELSSLTGSVFQNPRTQFFNLDTTGEIAFGMENLGVPRKEMHRAACATSCASSA